MHSSVFRSLAALVALSSMQTLARPTASTRPDPFKGLDVIAQKRITTAKGRGSYRIYARLPTMSASERAYKRPGTSPIRLAKIAARAV